MQRRMDELEAENRRLRGKLSSVRSSLLVTDDIVEGTGAAPQLAAPTVSALLPAFVEQASTPAAKGSLSNFACQRFVKGAVSGDRDKFTKVSHQTVLALHYSLNRTSFNFH